MTLSFNDVCLFVGGEARRDESVPQQGARRRAGGRVQAREVDRSTAPQFAEPESLVRINNNFRSLVVMKFLVAKWNGFDGLRRCDNDDADGWMDGCSTRLVGNNTNSLKGAQHRTDHALGATGTVQTEVHKDTTDVNTE